MSSTVTGRIPFGLRNVLLSLGMVFGPLLFVSAYLFVTRQWHVGTSSSGWGLDGWALGVGVAIGVVIVWKLSAPVRARPFLIGAYLLVATLFLVIYSLYFLCGVFGECL